MVCSVLAHEQGVLRGPPGVWSAGSGSLSWPVDVGDNGVLRRWIVGVGASGPWVADVQAQGSVIVSYSLQQAAHGALCTTVIKP